MKAKRFLAILLCALMLGDLFPVSTFAAEGGNPEENQVTCLVIWLNGDGSILDQRECYPDDAKQQTTQKIPTKAADDSATFRNSLKVPLDFSRNDYQSDTVLPAGSVCSLPSSVNNRLFLTGSVRIQVP